jgi:hypothetical protein
MSLIGPIANPSYDDPRCWSQSSLVMFAAEHVCIMLALATAALIGWAAARLRGTTLCPPAVWALGSVAAIAAGELLSAWSGVALGAAGPLRYAAAATTLCPMMAVLGAKRPQDRAWQWVVAALLGTLWLPAAHWYLLRAGESMELYPVWQAFVVVLVGLGPLNYFPTRNWLSALSVAAGQLLLFAPFAPWSRRPEGDWPVQLALALFLAAAILAWLLRWRLGATSVGAARGPWGELETLWRRFRDAYGAFWAVRVMQRVNQGLQSTGPAVTLTWHGWMAGRDAEEVSRPEFEPQFLQARRTLRTALRRFVRVEP